MGGGRKGGPPPETPLESFMWLREVFEGLKENYIDAWVWHEYLGDDVDEAEAERDLDALGMDPEERALVPKARSHASRLKAHLLSCCAELNRTAQAADLCYFHMCATPQEMRPCVAALGSAGDIDADTLLGSDDVSPEKLLAILQDKLKATQEELADRMEEIEGLKIDLAAALKLADDNWMAWQTAQMDCEEAYTRLNAYHTQLEDARDREAKLVGKLQVWQRKWKQAADKMIPQGALILRDKVLFKNDTDLQSVVFRAFIDTLYRDRQERLWKEYMEQRDKTEKAMKDEIKFCLAELPRRSAIAGPLVQEIGRLKQDRRALARRLMQKNRPRETAEYLLWVWELWQPVRARLVLEKKLERERDLHSQAAQLLTQTAVQLEPMQQRIDVLCRDLAVERHSRDIDRRCLVIEGATRAVKLQEYFLEQRTEELEVMQRIHTIDLESRSDKIAVLEREIAEDKHVKALKSMVIMLESRLRSELDTRRLRAPLPGGVGPKCLQCQREVLLRNWKEKGKLQLPPWTSNLKSSVGRSDSVPALPGLGVTLEGEEGTVTWDMEKNLRSLSQLKSTCQWR